MKLCLKVPFNSYLVGPSSDSLNLRTSFEEDDYLVKMVIEGDDPLELKASPSETKHFRKTTYLSFEITLAEISSENLEKFKLFVKEESQRLKLFYLLVSVVNRTLRSIRNFGVVAYIQEIRPKDSEIESYFRKWGVKFSEKNEEFQTIFPETMNLLQIYASSISDQKISELRISDWPDIEEAIQDKLEPAPEQEFLTNAIEFLRNRNFRMALLESVICLEIVLTQYLRAFLSVRKDIPDYRIKKFLTPQLGLTSRLSGLLDITLGRKDLNKINIQEILKAVEWRNHIIHKTGRLPKELKEDALRDGIWSILTLAELLARRRNQIQADPGLQKIAKEVSDDNKVPIPTIWARQRHHILVEIEFFFDEIPESRVFEKASQDLAIKLKQRDTRFEADKHLFVRFLQFPKKTIARWQKGNLEVIQEDIKS
jgi:hypothetical protein